MDRVGIDKSYLPRHVAIIMDGNGRWAKARNRPRSFGHRKGVERVKEIVRTSADMGIEVLTLYAFSTENWKRSQEEVRVLMSLLVEYLASEIDELDRQKVRFRSIGDRTALPGKLSGMLTAAEEKTARNTGLCLDVAINYGGRDEICAAARALALDYAAGKISDPGKESFEARLFTYGLPDVDFVIRTSGEERISNFLLYQIAYAELYFTKTLWPDFSSEEYVRAIEDFTRRNRRYGG